MFALKVLFLNNARSRLLLGIFTVAFLNFLSLHGAATLTPVGSWPAIPRGYLESVVLNGDLAYCPAGISGVLIYDVSNPASVQLVGRAVTGDAESVHVIRNRLVVGDNEGVKIFDLSNPRVPNFAGEWRTPHRNWGLTVEGNTVYVGTAGGFEILDISNSAAPARIGGISGLTYDVKVQGSYAYILNPTNLHVIDISDRTAPRSIAHAAITNTAASARRLEIENGLAYVAAGEAGLVIVNISDPTRPRLRGSYNTSRFALQVTKVGDIAYVADNFAGLAMINVTNSFSPKLVSVHPARPEVRGVAVRGSLAYIADGSGGLRVIDVSNPAAVVPVSDDNGAGRAHDIELNGNLGYLADQYAGLQVIDLSNVQSPAHLRRIENNYFAYRIHVHNQTAYLADDRGGLLIYDLADPTHPTLLGRYISPSSPSACLEVCANGTIAYVGDYDSLRILDVSDRSNPRLLGSAYIEDGGLRFVVLKSNYAYVGSPIGLTVLDVSNSASPAVVKSVSPDWAYSMDIAGDLAAFANTRGLYMYDLSNPAEPVQIGTLPFTLGFTTVRIAGNRAFLTSSFDIAVVDISDPTNPTILLRRTLQRPPTNLRVRDNLIYATTGYNGLEIFRLTEDFPPALRIQMVGGQIYVTWPTEGTGSYALQARPAFAAETPWNFMEIPPPPGDENRLSVEPQEQSSGFFRLLKP